MKESGGHIMFITSLATLTAHRPQSTHRPAAPTALVAAPAHSPSPASVTESRGQEPERNTGIRSQQQGIAQATCARTESDSDKAVVSTVNRRCKPWKARLTCVMNTTASSSSGSSQKTVAAAPPHAYEPAVVTVPYATGSARSNATHQKQKLDDDDDVSSNHSSSALSSSPFRLCSIQALPAQR